MMIKCPKCKTNEAPVHPQYGVTWCKDCNKAKPPMGGKYPEFIPERIKEDRRKYAKDILQPWRGGEPSREYMKAYPEKSKGMYTDQQRRKAKNIWQDIPGVKGIKYD